MSAGGMRNKNYPIILIGTFLLIMIQCGKGPEKASADESKITIGTGAGEWLFNMEHSGAAAQLMFLPLAYGESEPALAEKWEHSDDYKEWTFFLRKDVKWHDGALTTAHDVKFTMDLLKNPDVGDWRHL